MYIKILKNSVYFIFLYDKSCYTLSLLPLIYLGVDYFWTLLFFVFIGKVLESRGNSV